MVKAGNLDASTTEVVKIRVSSSQKELLKQKAKGHGYTTLSAFCRDRIFDDFGIHTKLNKLLELVEKKEDGTDGTERTSDTV